MTPASLVMGARLLVAGSVAVLPADSRDRYREEFGTELALLGSGQQMGQAGSLLLGAVALRRALQERELPLRGSPRPLRCRVGRHGYVRHNDDNPERRGRPYLRCVRCGNRWDTTDPEGFDVETYKKNSSFLAG